MVCGFRRGLPSGPFEPASREGRRQRRQELGKSDRRGAPVVRGKQIRDGLRGRCEIDQRHQIDVRHVSDPRGSAGDDQARLEDDLAATDRRARQDFYLVWFPQP